MHPWTVGLMHMSALAAAEAAGLSNFLISEADFVPAEVGGLKSDPKCEAAALMRTVSSVDPPWQIIKLSGNYPSHCRKGCACKVERAGHRGNSTYTFCRMERPACHIVDSAGYVVSSAGFWRFTQLYTNLASQLVATTPDVLRALDNNNRSGMWTRNRRFSFDRWVTNTREQSWFVLPAWGMQLHTGTSAGQNCFFQVNELKQSTSL